MEYEDVFMYILMSSVLSMNVFYAYIQIMRMIYFGGALTHLPLPSPACVHVCVCVCVCVCVV
jgi:ABC-type polysaccharide/polyol phosphate export permease